MGDMADWVNRQGMADEAQQMESLAGARNLSNAEIVEALVSHEDSDEQILDTAFAEKVQSICKWYQDKGFLTKRQRSCLNKAFAELDLTKVEAFFLPYENRASALRE